MSRTYRRRHEEWLFDGGDWVYNEEVDTFVKVKFHSHSKEYKKEKAFFHSDHYYECSVPQWYVNIFYQRPYRRKNNRIVQNYLKNPEKEIIISKFFKNAGYYYF